MSTMSSHLTIDTKIDEASKVTRLYDTVIEESELITIKFWSSVYGKVVPSPITLVRWTAVQNTQHAVWSWASTEELVGGIREGLYCN